MTSWDEKQTFTSKTGPIFVFPRIHTLTRDDSSLRGEVRSRHDPFILSGASSSNVMMNCPFSMFFEKPALEQSLVNFSLLIFTQQVSLYFGISLRNRVGSEKLLSEKPLISKFSSSAGSPVPREFLANSIHKSAAAS